MTGTIQLTRHGKYEDQPEALTQEGRLQSMEAVTELSRRGLGASAIILTSNAPRAIETATIIANGLRASRLIESRLIRDAGETISMVRSFDGVLEAALGIHDLDPATIGDLVVVTHMPLISLVNHGDPHEITEHGEVVEYVPGTWSNPDFLDNVLTQAFEQQWSLTPQERS